MKQSLHIELLTLPGCPGAEGARELLYRVLNPMGLAFTETVVRDADEAEQLGFIGSPSVRVNGTDIEPARRADSPAFACRTYNHAGKLRCEIPENLLRNALSDPPAPGQDANPN